MIQRPLIDLDPDELESLVLGFGSAVEVVAPGWLRERVAAEAGLMAAKNGA